MSAPDEVEVVGERPAESATDRELDRAAVQTFPAQSADELLRAVPGLHLSSHGGTGKALQFLVRGFDAAHGSDLLVTLEGVPLNEPSNVHGQGYVDVAFLPTLLVDGLTVSKGSYRARDGDFAITGVADYAVGLEPPGLTATTFLGTDRTGGGALAWRPEGGGPGSFAVAEAEGGVGVGDGRRYRQARAAAGVDGEVAGGVARLAAFVYDGAFESPGVLRSDDLEEGVIGQYGAYPEAGGGASRRVLALAGWERAESAVVAWGGLRDLTLDQNYTGYLGDPVRGDGTRQAEDATDAGVRAQAGRLGTLLGGPAAAKVGVDVRHVTVHAVERAVTAAGRPWEERLDARLSHLDAGGWVEGRWYLAHRLTLVPGLRADWLALGRDDATSTAAPLSPRGSAAWEVADAVTLFGAAGRGFRSPSALGIADGDRAPVTRTTSAEAGARWAPVDTLGTSVSGFDVEVGDELLFDHVAARFLSAGRTRRLGGELVLDWGPLSWLRWQVDASLTDGRFVVTHVPIPYAPRFLGAVGGYLESAPVGRGARLSGGLRVFALGTRPLPSGFASHPAAVASLTSQLEVGRALVGLDVENLLGGRWRDGEFVFPSWFDRDTARSELKVLHVTAGDPFVARVQLGGRW